MSGSNLQNPDTPPPTEKEIFLASLEQKRAEGMLDIKFFPGETFDSSEEEIYAELNRMENAPSVPDTELV